MPFRFLLALLLILPSALHAKETPILDPAFCRALVKHVPDADVAYRPGVDVRGKPVVPADLGGQPQMDLPEEVVLPITADMFKLLGLDQSKFPFQAMQRNDIYLGTLTVRGEQLFWNGKPLSDAQQDNLAVLCMKPTKKP